VILSEKTGRLKMVTKKTTKKRAAKKTSHPKRRKKGREIDDPPIIVGGGSSEIIRIRGDLSVSLMPPAGGYNRFRVAGVNIRHVTVDGNNHPVNPATNNVVFTE
jgi:hypothetical protein